MAAAMLQGGMILPQGGAGMISGGGGVGGGGGIGVLQLPPAPDLNMQRQHAPSPFSVVANPHQTQQQPTGGPPAAAPASFSAAAGGGGTTRIGTSASPFAAGPLMNTISEAFPNWQQGQPPDLETGAETKHEFCVEIQSPLISLIIFIRPVSDRFDESANVLDLQMCH